VDGAYSITPGAPHSERVLPPPQRKSTTSADANIMLDHRRKDKGKRAEGHASASTPALGLFINSSAEVKVPSLVVDASIRAMARGPAESEPVVVSSSNRLWNGAVNSLGMDMDMPSANGYHGPGRNDDRNRSHGRSRSNGDVIRPSVSRHGSSNTNGLADFSLLSPLDSSGNVDQRTRQGLDEVLNGSNGVDVATPQSATSATSWGTTNLSSQSSRSTFSVGDMELNGLPSLPSRSSLNLNITGLHDFEDEGIDGDDETDEEDHVTPSIGRHPDLSQSRQAVSIPRSTEVSENHNLRPNNSRHLSIPDRTHVGMTPRVVSRSVSDTTHSAFSASRLMGLEEEELEVVGMRFSQSLSGVEPVPSGSSVHVSGSLDDASITQRDYRRRASTSITSDFGPLETDRIDIAQPDEEALLSAHPRLESRSVSFSTPKPRSDAARSQLPQTNGRSHSIYASFVQKRSQTPKAIPAMPYVNTTRVVASSSAANGAGNPMHRGVATIAAPPRPLPNTSYDPTYTSVMPSNGRSLPAHYANPYVAPNVFPQNGTDNHGIYTGTQQPYASFTLQPVSAPTESSSQPKSMSSITQAPVLHAPQPVSGKSHIGRPWRDWAK
jgi:hypothetical protein